jgi:hypothetical protein
MDVPRQPTIAQVSPQSMPPYPDATSTIFASRARMPASVTKCVSRLGLVHHFCSAHGLALARSELLPGLRHGGRDALPPALRKAAVQHSHQFRLRIGIELFGSIKNISECILLTHDNLVSTILPVSPGRLQGTSCLEKP